MCVRVRLRLRHRHITVIYNPVGGGGKAKRLVAHMVVPVLQLAKLRFTVTPTQYRSHAVRSPAYYCLFFLFVG